MPPITACKIYLHPYFEHANSEGSGESCEPSLLGNAIRTKISRASSNIDMLSNMFSDSEGDVVAFSTDEELKEALAAVNDGILNVYVAMKSK